jgi:hypothetical protein
VSVTLNWNPSYSYAKLPEGVKDMPDYWRVLTEAVTPEKGMPHFRNVWISGLKATGAQRAFAVSSYRDSPLVHFILKDIDIEAKTAGTIANSEGWKFENVNVKTEDRSTVEAK